MHTWESKHAYRKWPERMWMRTWAVTRKALSRSEVSAQLRNNFEHVIEQNKIDHAWQLNQTNNQSIIKKSHMLGPHQSPIYIAWIKSHESHYFGIMKIRSCLLKPRGAEDCLKAIAELKLFGRKLDFLNLIEKLEYRRSLENWSFRIYLEIRLLEIECENENF